MVVTIVEPFVGSDKKETGNITITLNGKDYRIKEQDGSLIINTIGGFLEEVPITITPISSNEIKIR